MYLLVYHLMGLYESSAIISLFYELLLLIVMFALQFVSVREREGSLEGVTSGEGSPRC